MNKDSMFRVDPEAHGRSSQAYQSRLRRSFAWQQLEHHHSSIKHVHMTEMFAEDSERFQRFSIQFNGMLLDYSKNRINVKTMQLLTALAEQENVGAWRDKMFSGEKINNTEQRAVLHTALRNRSDKPVFVDGHDVMPDVSAELGRMREFVDKVNQRVWLGYAGIPVKHIVNIGIGGSDLGPQMVTNALSNDKGALKIHYVSNVDAEQINETLSMLRPEDTMFIISSKTFTTQETMTNAETAKAWFLRGAGRVQSPDIGKHFVAVTNNVEAANAFGISEDNIYRLWDWVGGRYSLWSSIGLSVALAIGMDKFEDLLDGAYAMDEHFRETPLDQNLPVVLALLGIWYGNFFNAESAAILPYNYSLRKFPAFLEQMDMESNGKSVDRDGKPIGYNTGKIIWGAEGINGQHAFYQLLHQGTRLIPTDFIFAIKSLHDKQEHTDIVAANFLAQTEALMIGRDDQQTRKVLEGMNMTPDEIEQRLPHMVFLGNQPSNSILMQELDAHTLGSLIAMYEHKVFVQGIIWNLNSYDQWGVELGKILTNKILAELQSGDTTHEHDHSTRALIDWVSSSRS